MGNSQGQLQRDPLAEGDHSNERFEFSPEADQARLERFVDEQRLNPALIGNAQEVPPPPYSVPRNDVASVQPILGTAPLTMDEPRPNPEQAIHAPVREVALLPPPVPARVVPQPNDVPAFVARGEAVEEDGLWENPPQEDPQANIPPPVPRRNPPGYGDIGHDVVVVPPFVAPPAAVPVHNDHQHPEPAGDHDHAQPGEPGLYGQRDFRGDDVGNQQLLLLLQQMHRWVWKTESWRHLRNYLLNPNGLFKFTPMFYQVPVLTAYDVISDKFAHWEAYYDPEWPRPAIVMNDVRADSNSLQDLRHDPVYRSVEIRLVSRWPMIWRPEHIIWTRRETIDFELLAQLMSPAVTMVPFKDMLDTMTSCARRFHLINHDRNAFVRFDNLVINATVSLAWCLAAEERDHVSEWGFP